MFHGVAGGLEQAAAAVVVTRSAEIRDSAIGVLVAGRMQGDNVRVLFDARGAAIFGAAAGLVLWSLGRLVRR